MLACRSVFLLVFVWRMPNSEEIRRIYELGLKPESSPSYPSAPPPQIP